MLGYNISQSTVSYYMPKNTPRSKQTLLTFLHNHLKETISWIESNSPIELLAIGIRHDVTNYYKKAVTINDVEKLAKTMTEDLIELFDS